MAAGDVTLDYARRGKRRYGRSVALVISAALLAAAVYGWGVPAGRELYARWSAAQNERRCIARPTGWVPVDIHNHPLDGPYVAYPANGGPAVIVSSVKFGARPIVRLARRDGATRVIEFGVITPYGLSTSDPLYPAFIVREPVSFWKPRDLGRQQIGASSHAPDQLDLAGPIKVGLHLDRVAPDPADPTHATLHYTLDGVPGAFDLYLQNDDTVVAEPRGQVP